MYITDYGGMPWQYYTVTLDLFFSLLFTLAYTVSRDKVHYNTDFMPVPNFELVKLMVLHPILLNFIFKGCFKTVCTELYVCVCGV